MNSHKIQKNYCIGIVPSDFSYNRIIEFKKEIIKANKLEPDDNYFPIINLIDPFDWDEKNEYLMVSYLKKYAESSYSFDIEFNGFDKFDDQISLKISEKEQITKFQKSLEYYIEIHSKLKLGKGFDSVFEPKLFLNITPDTTRKMNKIWNFLKENSFNIHFTANKICLLNLKSNKWSIVKEFELE
ncbi:MAG: hypothetical protein ACOYMA_16440 [Bacteroidia bacterium]